MVSDNSGRASDGPMQKNDWPQDPIVSHLRPDPEEPPKAANVLNGFLGNSDRPGFQRLYLTRDLDYFVEFRVEDVLHLAPIPEAELLGDKATRISLRRDATVE
ncbi:hypothetical protein ACIQK5_18525 [Streptomyces virginiae]|uniref:hypothetical protein n=1 Tax=Streptomyces virginiae TaxID=1961 RepID=UPI0037F1BE6D